MDDEDNELSEDNMENSGNGDILPSKASQIKVMNVFSVEGPAVGINQGVISITHQRLPPLTDDEKREKLMKDVKENLRQHLLSVEMRHIPWLDKSMTVEDHYVNLCLMMEGIDGKEQQQKQITLDGILQLIDKGSKFILIEGKPGFGKTTLAHKISQLWAAGKLPSFNFLFTTELRRHTLDSIEGFILNQNSKLNGKEIYTEDVVKTLKYSKVLFVLDGVDEIPYSQKENIMRFIQEIREGDNFQAVFTSRPTELFKDLDLNISEKIVIRGFSKDGRIAFVDQYFRAETGSANVERILQTLENNNNVSELCECPLMLLLFCFLLDNNPDDYDLPTTLTDLFKEIVNFVINRFQEKNVNRKIAEKVDLFQQNLSKQIKLIVRHLYSFGEKVLEALKENRVIFKEEEVQGDLLLQIGFLLKVPSTDGFVEPFHTSINEFFCGYFLSKLYLEEDVKFKNLFPEFLNLVEKEDSLIFPFLCGLLKEMSQSIITFIPEWFYFGNWSNYLILIQECSRFLTDKDYLLKINPTDLYLDLTIINNKVIVLDNRLKQNLKTRNFTGEGKWRDMIINVHHNALEYPSQPWSLKNFEGSSIEILRITFPCQSLNDTESVCSEKPFSQSQLSLLMDELLKLKPYSLEINFPRCVESVSILTERISRTNLQFKWLNLHNYNYQEEIIREASTVIIKQRLNELSLSSERNDLAVSNERDVTMDIHPLIQAIESPVCVLHSLYLSNVIISKDVFISLMDSISQSFTINNLKVHFTYPSEKVIDLSQLGVNGKQWIRINLKHIQVIWSKPFPLAVNDLILMQCAVNEEDSIRLFSFCTIAALHCDNQVLKAVCQESARTVASSHSLSHLAIEYGIMGVTPQIFSKFLNLNWLMLDFRDGFETNLINKQHFITLVIERRIPLNVRFIMTFDSAEYLKEIEFIVACIEDVTRNSQSIRRINTLQLYFLPQMKPLNIEKETVLKKIETENLLQNIAKLHPFLASDVFTEFVIKIRQSKQRGHFFGPFLMINYHFPSELFDIHYEYNNQWSRAQWTITKKPATIVEEADIQIKQNNEKKKRCILM